MPKFGTDSRDSRRAERVVAFIDGMNLHFGILSRGLRSHTWVDPVSLVRKLLRPSQDLVAVKFFTSRIPGSRPGEDLEVAARRERDRQVQDIYLDALEVLDHMEVHYGHFLNKERRCGSCGRRWPQSEEKKTDVLIACHLLTAAMDEVCDRMILISGDGDLSPPVRIVRERFPSTRIIVAFPPGRRSAELQRSAHGHLHICDSKVRRSQLPRVVITPGGVRLERPLDWQ